MPSARALVHHLQRSIPGCVSICGQPQTSIRARPAHRYIVRTSAMAATKVQDVEAFIEDLNTKYEQVRTIHQPQGNTPSIHTQVHKAYEDNFWATKMGLDGCSADALAASKTRYDAFLSDAANLNAVRIMLQEPLLSDKQKKVVQPPLPAHSSCVYPHVGFQEIASHTHTHTGTQDHGKNIWMLHY